MDFNHFIRHRRPRWQRLTELLDLVDRGGMRALSGRQADELYNLYRLACSDLNLAQSRTGNPALLSYLEALVGRAYAMMSVPRRGNILLAWWAILRQLFPHAIRETWPMLALSAGIMTAGIVFGALAMVIDPDAGELLIMAEHQVETPSARVARLEALEAGGSSQLTNPGEQASFATFLFTHNIRVTVLCFALGLTFGIGTAAVLFFNGVMVGALGAWYFEEGVFEFFIAWVGPHGSIELPCIMFSGAAGFLLARAQLRRDHGSFGHQLRELRPTLIRLVVGTASFLVLAGLIEGGFSQINEPTIPYPVKITVAVVLHVLLWVYLFVMPVPRPREDAGR